MGALSFPDIPDNEIVAVAVSGGGDSMALLAMAAGRLVPRGMTLISLTVDHGLRPESRLEAEAVARWCANRGIAHRILEWRGPKPQSGVQDAARAARYRLLAEAARAAGARIVLTGHTQDDQLETVWMRNKRGDGPGLAGIAPATLAFDPADCGRDVWFVRPLLQETRAGLRAWLRSQGIGWSDDPSNEDARHERVRARRAIAGMDAAERDALVEKQRLAAALRYSDAGAAAACLDTHWRMAAPGLFRAATEPFSKSIEGSAAALRHVLAFAGGTALPDATRTARLAERLGREERLRATLARCVIDKRKADIFVHREARGMGERGGVFDGRFRWITSKTNSLSVPETLQDVPPSLVNAAAAALPPERAGGQWWPLLNPWPELLPEFDVAIARAMARLAGLPEPQSGPFDRPRDGPKLG